MKKIIIVAVCLTAMLAVSCRSTRLHGKKPKVDTGKVTMVDYQGKALGSDVPKWVMSVSEGNDRNVRKDLHIDDNKKIWLQIKNGVDKELLIIEAEKLDVKSRVAQSISSEIALSTQSALSARVDFDDVEKQKVITDIAETFSGVELSGLEKEASYWVKTQTETGKGKLISEYTYYGVFTMDNEMYEQQLEKALKNNASAVGNSEIMKILKASVATSLLPENSVQRMLD